MTIGTIFSNAVLHYQKNQPFPVRNLLIDAFTISELTLESSKRTAFSNDIPCVNDVQYLQKCKITEGIKAFFTWYYINIMVKLSNAPKGLESIQFISLDQVVSEATEHFPLYNGHYHLAEDVITAYAKEELDLSGRKLKAYVHQTFKGEEKMEDQICSDNADKFYIWYYCNYMVTPFTN